MRLRRSLSFLVLGGVLLLLAGNGQAFPSAQTAAWALRSYGGGDLAVGDFNADGLPDLAWTYTLGDAVYLHDQGPGGFSADPNRAIPLQAPSRLSVADLDGRGGLDLLAVAGADVAVFTDLDTGGLSPAYRLSAPGAIQGASGDLNGDGRTDIAVLTESSLLLWFQETSGVFSLAPSLEEALPGFQSLALADLDGDGRQDVVLAKPWEVRLLLLRTVGEPAEFRSHHSESFGDRVAVAAGDIDRDGRTDLVLAKSDSSGGLGRLEIWRQEAGGAFQVSPLVAGSLTERFVLEDLSDDGDLDLAVVRLDGDVALYTQVGGGVFSPATPQVLQGNEAGASEVLAAADINGDTYTDLVLRGGSTASLSVFLQEDRAPTRTGLPIPAVLLQEGQTVLSGWDLRTFLHDDHDAATYTVEALSGPEVRAVPRGHRLEFTAAPGVYGRASFRVTATDGVPGHVGAVSDEIVVTVNAFPRILSRPPSTLLAGEEAAYTLEVVDPYPAGEAHRIVFLDAPEGMTWDRGLEVRWTPTGAQAGIHDVTIVVEDSLGGRSAPHFFVVEVFAPTPPPPPSAAPAFVAAGALAAVAALGAGAALNENVRWSVLLFFLPLYSKIRREAVLDHFVRGQIYGYILSSPGEHYNAIKQALGLTNGSLAHHLKTLEREEFIRSRRFGLYRRFYPRNYKIPESDAFFLNPIQRRLLGLVRDAPGISQKELSTLLGLTPPTVNYHVSLLAEHGHVRVVRNGRMTGIYADAPEDPAVPVGELGQIE